jgi:hypothetical protein
MLSFKICTNHAVYIYPNIFATFKFIRNRFLITGKTYMKIIAFSCSLSSKFDVKPLALFCVSIWTVFCFTLSKYPAQFFSHENIFISDTCSIHNYNTCTSLFSSHNVCIHDTCIQKKFLLLEGEILWFATN